MPKIARKPSAVKRRRRPTFRSRPRPSDVPALRRLVAATRVFYTVEQTVAAELLEERLRRGADSGYSFFFADCGAELVGYCAWGAVPLTRNSYDLYWIAVAPQWQGAGIGQRLMELAERAVARCGGGGLYIETSSRGIYDRTRRFYRRAGYRQVARFRDFYAPDDHKIVLCKLIPAARERQ
jgi:ribosomal protein S18 acetylase RimI-like enzyme